MVHRFLVFQLAVNIQEPLSARELSFLHWEYGVHYSVESFYRIWLELLMDLFFHDCTVITNS